jgi:hypothetical protein
MQGLSGLAIVIALVGIIVSLNRIADAIQAKKGNG